MSHIFISYSHKDKAYVHKLQGALQSEGFDVWIDDRINYGTTWPKVIQRHLDDCGAFIVVMTENAYESEWVQNEVTRARRKNKPFFALLLRGETWLSFEAVQYEDVSGERLPGKKFYEDLARVIPRAAAERAAQEKLEREEAERVKRVRAEREAAERAAREKAKREAIERANLEKANRQAVRRVAITKTVSESFSALKTGLTKSIPALKIAGFTGLTVMLFWFGSWGISKLFSRVPTSSPAITQRPITQVTSTDSPIPPTKTQTSGPTSTTVPVNASGESASDLTVHYVEGIPAEDQATYNVKAYLSVVDSSGMPVRSLPAEAFSLAEDAQKVEITNVATIAEEPINIVLVMDNSGSMAGTGIAGAKAAAVTFVSGLKSNDQLSIVTFDENVRIQMDFTNDRDAIANEIASIDAIPGTGSCLYDAAYAAVQSVSAVPSENRAVILLTDGRDETANGTSCSRHTVDDVISLASGTINRTPIYTLGLGPQMDDTVLQRLADLTGGRFLFSPDSLDLINNFQLLSNQLRSQYLLSYKSLSLPGSHTLTVSLNQAGVQDTRSFVLPALPARVVFITPLVGDSINDSMKIAVSIITQAEKVQRVAFEINGAEVGSDDVEPYEIEVDTTLFPPGAMTVSAIVYGEGNVNLAQSSVNIIHVADSATASPAEVVSTPNPATQTVSAAFTALAISTQTVVSTSAALPSTSFADDLGVPGILMMAAALVIIVLLIRRLRAA